MASVLQKLVRGPARLPRTETGQSIARAGGFAVAVVALVVLLKYVIDGPLGREGPFLLMLAATVAATWYGGRWAGILAAAVGSAAVNYFFLPPYDDWHVSADATVQTVLFGAESLLVVGLTSMLVTARRHAELATGRVRRLYAVSSALVRTRTLEDVGETIVREGASALGSTTASLFVAADARRVLQLVAHCGMPPALVERLREIPLDGNLPAATVMRTGETLCERTRAELLESVPELAGCPHPWPSLRSLLCAPVGTDPRPFGVLSFGFDREQDFSPDDRELAASLARDCATAIERSRMYEAERLAHLEAEEASRAKDEFLGVVSHELRTPLTAIAGWVHLLRRGWAADPQRAARGLDVIERNLKAESRLVEDLIDMSRIVARRLRVQPTAVDLTSVTRAVVEELEPTAVAKGIELSMHAGGPVRVAGDADRLAQIARNLVSNAVKFTPNAGHVSVDVQSTGQRAVLRVRDDGPGLPAEELPYVFEMFRQVDRSTTRRESGLGLGLAIVRGLVEAHGGTVQLESSGPAQGTTAIVQLPTLEAGRVDRREPRPEPTPTLAGLRVLVVDDERDTLEAVCELLAQAGAEVLPAESASTALEVLDRFTPDVLVSDVSMPERDGYWLIRELRAAGTRTAAVPALALTAHAGAESAQAALAAGFQRHISKPPMPDVLTTAIAELARGAA